MTQHSPLGFAAWHMRRLHDRWSMLPLRAQLTMIVASIMAVGLMISGVITTVLTRQLMLSQVDAQLVDTASRMSTAGLSTLASASGTTLMPSDYYVEIQMDNGVTGAWHGGVVASYGVPDLTGAPSAYDYFTERFSVPGTGADAQATSWRVIGIPVIRIDTGVHGTAYLALPMADFEATMSKVKVLLLGLSIAIATAGGVLGYAAIQRALRPLSRIEQTASAIAGGDLSARVPPRPLTTEVGSLSHSLNIMLAQIESSAKQRDASEARMRRFASDASHELRTPLAAIRGYSELYEMGALSTPADLDDTMRRIKDSARRMGLLVEDLLTLTRLDEGQSLQHVPVNLTALADDATADLFALDPTRSVRHESTGDSPLWVLGDEDKLRQVVLNLVGNTARHTPAGTPVEIVTYRTTDAAGTRLGVLEVRDHGPGIPQADAERVFERFYRADTSRDRRSGGSGLGLAIVKAICTSLGGTAEVATTPGSGLTVRISIPELSAPV